MVKPGRPIIVGAMVPNRVDPEVSAKLQANIKRIRRTPNTGVVVVGMVTSGQCPINDTMGRDKSRIARLREEFEEVFSLSQDIPSDVIVDSVYHVTAKMSKSGAKKLLKLFRKEHPYMQVQYCFTFLHTPIIAPPTHTTFCTPQLKYIMLDWMRCPKGYYQQLVCGGFEKRASQAGSDMIKFLEVLQGNKVLASECRVIFSRISGFDRFDDVVKNLEKKFGLRHKFIPATENPLYVASEAAEEGGDWQCDRTYYAKKELKKLVDGIKYVRPCCTPLLQNPYCTPLCMHSCTPLVQNPYCTPLCMHRHQPEKPFVEFLFRVTPRRKSLRSHSGGHGPLSCCATREEWIDKLMEIGSLAVPGSWWTSSTAAERKKTYMCYIENVQYANGQYTFWIALNAVEVDSSKFCNPSPFCTHLFCTPLVHTPVLHTILNVHRPLLDALAGSAKVLGRQRPVTNVPRTPSPGNN